MAKLIWVDAHILIHGEVIVNVHDGNGRCLFQMCLDLIGQNTKIQFLVLMWPQCQSNNMNVNPKNTKY